MDKRLKQIIDYYHLSTRQFEQKISVSNGVIAKVLAQNTTLRSDILSKIADTFPEINIGWLLTGKGQMLNSEAPKPAPSSADSDKIWKEILADKDRRIEELIIENYQIREQVAHIQAVTPPISQWIDKDGVTHFQF